MRSNATPSRPHAQQTPVSEMHLNRVESTNLKVLFLIITYLQSQESSTSDNDGNTRLEPALQRLSQMYAWFKKQGPECWSTDLLSWSNAENDLQNQDFGIHFHRFNSFSTYLETINGTIMHKYSLPKSRGHGTDFVIELIPCPSCGSRFGFRGLLNSRTKCSQITRLHPSNFGRVKNTCWKDLVPSKWTKRRFTNFLNRNRLESFVNRR